MFEPADIERLLHEAVIAAGEAGLRDEDRRKAAEVAGFLEALSRARRRGHLVDAAGGKGYLGVIAARTLPFSKVTVIERNPRLLRDVGIAARRLGVGERVHLVEGEVGDPSAWPPGVDVIAGLHACGRASDDILDAAVRLEVPWLLLAPCCYGSDVPFAPLAEAKARSLGIDGHPEIRRRYVCALIDSERTLRLEAAGWQTTIAPFAPPVVTPHHLLWRGRRVKEPSRMAWARERLDKLRESVLLPE